MSRPKEGDKKKKGNKEGDKKRKNKIKKEIGPALLPVNDRRTHENPVVFFNSSGTRGKEHLARVVTTY